LAIFRAEADTSADIQGTWTLSQIEMGDTTTLGDTIWIDSVNYEIVGEADILSDGGKYLYDFPLGTTALSISGTDFVFTYYGGGSRQWAGVTDLTDPVLTLNGDPTNCGDCDPKVLVFIIRSVSATELILDRFDEDYGTPTFAHYTFTK
jgi:hypothetical protein